jgi:hypothetical protein
MIGKRKKEGHEEERKRNGKGKEKGRGKEEKRNGVKAEEGKRKGKRNGSICGLVWGYNFWTNGYR